MRKYAVKEIFLTLQGEGANAGRAAVFCRFSGCNLWSGQEKDRGLAGCRFCDTDFVGLDGTGGGSFADAEALAMAIEGAGIGGKTDRFIVFTGGDPVQLDATLIGAVHAGAKSPSNQWDVCPAARRLGFASARQARRSFCQLGVELARFPQRAWARRICGLAFSHFWLQPMDGDERAANTAAAIAYCLDHPRWRHSLQTHKFLGIP
jgi:7-carboxy-7-deazaguanine synthase (Cx14CxxC type)